MTNSEVEQGSRFRRVLARARGPLVVVGVVVAICALGVIARRLGRDPEGTRIAESERLEGLDCKVSWTEGDIVLKPEDAGEAIAILRDALCQKINTDITSFGLLAPPTQLYYHSLDVHGQESRLEFILDVYSQSHIRLRDRVTLQDKWLENRALVRRIDSLVESLPDAEE